MFPGVLALLERSLRVDARAWMSHLARGGLLLAIYLAVLQIQAFAFAFGAPGLQFFQSIVYLNLVFMTLLGIGFFSTAITEEKEEDTLGLMQMAGISPLGILLGKIGGRLLQALLLIAVQYPFTLLSITLGGVADAQVQAAYVGLTAYLLGLAGWGLLCSTVSQNSRSASRLMVLGLFAYWLVSYFAGEWQASLARSGMGASKTWLKFELEWIASSCVYLEVGSILTTGATESPWSIQAITNPIGGGLCLLLSWAVFDRCTRSPTTEPVSRGWLTRRRGSFRWFSPGRPQVNPFVWKDFHFAAGGVANLLVRLSLYLGLFVVVWLLAQWWHGNYVIQMYLGCLLPVIAFDASLLVSRSLHDEVRGQTLPALVMLPRPVSAIVYSKLGGALLGLLPGLMCFLCVSVGTDDGRQFLGEVLFRGNSGVPQLISQLLLLPHFAAVFSLAARWGAVPLAIGSIFALSFVERIVLGFMLFVMMQISSYELYLYVSTVAHLGLCVACHVSVLRRFRKLAER